MKQSEYDLSLVVPCFNEESSLKRTVSTLVRSFTKHAVSLHLVLVDNGSNDRTGEIIDELVEEGLSITKVSLRSNRGYGYGILQGFKHCTAPLVGFYHADGQVSAEDVVIIYRLMLGREGLVLAKARRRLRQDGRVRWVISLCYNSLTMFLFGWLGAIDVNASPKILQRENLEAMRLQSADWFLDPEILIKAKHLGLVTVEVDVIGYARQGGVSKVWLGTALEFLKNMLRYRFGGALKRWRDHPQTGEAVKRIRHLRDQLVYEGGNVPVEDRLNISNPFGDVLVLEQKRHEDSRGTFRKVLTASQCRGNPVLGEVYVTTAKPGEVKGNHLHRRMGEWFSVIQGTGLVALFDPVSNKRHSVPVDGKRASALYVPAGIAHAIVNTGNDVLVCVASAEAEHDPDDVFPYAVWPKG